MVNALCQRRLTDTTEGGSNDQSAHCELMRLLWHIRIDGKGVPAVRVVRTGPTEANACGHSHIGVVLVLDLGLNWLVVLFAVEIVIYGDSLFVKIIIL